MTVGRARDNRPRKRTFDSDLCRRHEMSELRPFQPSGFIEREPQCEDQPLVSVVLPCLNEEQAIGACIEKIQATFAASGIQGEIVVCDNGSSDRSVEIAESMGARVVHQPIRGYGNAYLKGFASARGEYLVMGDADDTYDFSLIPRFLDTLK